MSIHSCDLILLAYKEHCTFLKEHQIADVCSLTLRLSSLIQSFDPPQEIDMKLKGTQDRYVPIQYGWH